MHWHIDTYKIQLDIKCTAQGVAMPPTHWLCSSILEAVLYFSRQILLWRPANLTEWRFTSHSTQNRSFWKRSSQPIFWLGSEETKPNTTKCKQHRKLIYRNRKLSHTHTHTKQIMLNHHHHHQNIYYKLSNRNQVSYCTVYTNSLKTKSKPESTCKLNPASVSVRLRHFPLTQTITLTLTEPGRGNCPFPASEPVITAFWPLITSPQVNWTVQWAKF